MTDSETTANSESSKSTKPAGHSLHFKILMGLIVGATLGIGVNYASSGGERPHWLEVVLKIAEPLGQVFLRLMLMVVVPLVFAALSLGVIGLGDVRRLGKIGLRTLILTLCFSFSAVAIGILLVDTIKPGAGLPEE